MPMEILCTFVCYTMAENNGLGLWWGQTWVKIWQAIYINSYQKCGMCESLQISWLLQLLFLDFIVWLVVTIDIDNIVIFHSLYDTISSMWIDIERKIKFLSVLQTIMFFCVIMIKWISWPWVGYPDPRWSSGLGFGALTATAGVRFPVWEKVFTKPPSHLRPLCTA